MKTQISKKAAKRIGELFNTISVSRLFTDEANTKTAEGRDQWVRWMDNGIEAARELRDSFGITLPYWTAMIESDESIEKATGFMRQMVKWDQQQAEHEHRRSLMTDEQKTAAAQEWIAGTARSLQRSA